MSCRKIKVYFLQTFIYPVSQSYSHEITDNFLHFEKRNKENFRNDDLDPFSTNY